MQEGNMKEDVPRHQKEPTEQDNYDEIPVRTSEILLRSNPYYSYRICHACKEVMPLVALQKCGRCKRVFYCDRECQRKDWLYHKQTCIDVNNSTTVVSAVPKMRIEKIELPFGVPPPKPGSSIFSIIKKHPF
jgi:hypothetical protein